jgi:hypothetical protein
MVKHGIYYSEGEGDKLLVNIEGAGELRQRLTHIEFWDKGEFLQRVPIGQCTHDFLVNLSKNGNWPQIIKDGLLPLFP